MSHYWIYLSLYILLWVFLSSHHHFLLTKQNKKSKTNSRAQRFLRETLSTLSQQTNNYPTIYLHRYLYMFVYMYYIYSIDINLGHTTTTTTQTQQNFRLRFRFRCEVSSSLRLALFTLCISLVSALLTGECGTGGGQRSSSTSVWRECSVLTETLRKLAKQVSNQANSLLVTWQQQQPNTRRCSRALSFSSSSTIEEHELPTGLSSGVKSCVKYFI